MAFLWILLGSIFAGAVHDYFSGMLTLGKKFKEQAKANKIDTFNFAFEDLFLTKLIERMDQNQEIFEMILENKAFGGIVKELLMKSVYLKLNETEEVN